jgi:Uma2 family endonuclease
MVQTPVQTLAVPTLGRSVDQHQVFGDRTWAQFEHLKQGYEGCNGLRLSFFDGVIEVLVPGQDHEIFSHIIGWFLTTFLGLKGIEFVATGSADQEKPKIAFLQPDQSYCIGSRKVIPDLSIELCSRYANEVVFSSGGPNKLTKYRALGVPEVWFWEDGTLALYHLRADGYEKIKQSELAGLADLDLDLLKRCIILGETDMSGAMRTFMQAI